MMLMMMTTRANHTVKTVRFEYIIFSLLFAQQEAKAMVVSSGFLDHAAEVYLRANGLIMSAPPITSLNRGIDWSQSTNQLQQQQTTNQLPTQQLNQQPPPNSSVMQTISTKVSNGQQAPARVILVCHSNSHAFQVKNNSPRT